MNRAALVRFTADLERLLLPFRTIPLRDPLPLGLHSREYTFLDFLGKIRAFDSDVDKLNAKFRGLLRGVPAMVSMMFSRSLEIILLKS